MLISTALLLDSIIRNSVCTPAKLPCRRVEVGYEIIIISNGEHTFKGGIFKYCKKLIFQIVH
jgi:hypothetical protein